MDFSFTSKPRFFAFLLRSCNNDESELQIKKLLFENEIHSENWIEEFQFSFYSKLLFNVRRVIGMHLFRHFSTKLTFCIKCICMR